MASIIKMKQNDFGERVSDREKFLKEAEELHKRAVHREIRVEFLRLAKSRFGILFSAGAFLLLLGAGGSIYFFINDRIGAEMVRVDQKVIEIFHPIQFRENLPVETIKVHNQVMEKIRTIVKDELSSEKAAQQTKNEEMVSSQRNDQNTETIDKLNRAVTQVEGQAAQLEEGLTVVRKELHLQRENDRKMSHPFTGISQTKIHDLEKAVEKMAQNLKVLVQSETEFKRNAQYEIQITYAKGSENVVDYLAGVLHDQGFRISTWPNIRKIDTVYGVSIDSLENKISILPAPGEPVIGERIARIIREDGGVPVVRTGVDKATNSRPSLVGLLIPPNCSLPAELMKSSVKM